MAVFVDPKRTKDVEIEGVRFHLGAPGPTAFATFRDRAAFRDDAGRVKGWKPFTFDVELLRITLRGWEPVNGGTVPAFPEGDLEAALALLHPRHFGPLAVEAWRLCEVREEEGKGSASP